MSNQKVDPFTLEIIKDGLVAIGDEMFVTMQRTSMSTIIYEVLDFAVGLTDAQGRLMTQGNGVTLFLGTLDFAVRRVLEKFEGDIHPGDVFITNDPYTTPTNTGGGTHLSDVSIIAPIFYEDRLVAFAANMGHWTEVGGMAAGSWTTNSTEIYQEGLQFPCVRLFDRGQVNQSLIDLIRANVRTPDMSIGDMYAQIASVRIAERRFQEMCAKYGVEVVLSGMDAWLDYTEELTRQELRKFPDGVYEAVDYIDDDGLSDESYEVRVKVIIKDGQVTCDFTGTHEQVPGPINCSRTALNSASRVLFMAFTNPSIPASHGCFRALNIVCPEGTILTCQRPAPVSTYWETAAYASDLIWKAMAPLFPDRLPAGHFLSVCGTIVSGIHPDTGELFLLVEPQAGGWGAGVDKDGENGLVCIDDGETYIIPVEVCETRYGVIVDQYALDITEGGAGEHRGGRGLVRDYRITAEEAYFTGTYGRFKFLPWGMNDGVQGSKNYTVFLHNDDTEAGPYGKTAQYRLKKGEVARLITGTGGGYGDPLKRPIQQVQEDVKNGYITLQHAEQDYGVVLNPDTLEVEKLINGRKS